MDFNTLANHQSAHDFLNLLSKLTGGSKDQGLAFNQAIVQLNDIKPIEEGNNFSLLNCRRLLKTYTAKNGW
jgi:hypothetical protein